MPDKENLDQSEGALSEATVEDAAALAALDDDGGAPEVVPDEDEEQARPKGWTPAPGGANRRCFGSGWTSPMCPPCSSPTAS